MLGLEASRCLLVLGNELVVLSVAFSPDGNVIACSKGGRTIRVWDVHSAQLQRPPIQVHHGVVFSVAFSLDGRLIASGEDDGTVGVWDVCVGMPLCQNLSHVRREACQRRSDF